MKLVVVCVCLLLCASVLYTIWGFFIHFFPYLFGLNWCSSFPYFNTAYISLPLIFKWVCVCVFVCISLFVLPHDIEIKIKIINLNMRIYNMIVLCGCWFFTRRHFSRPIFTMLSPTSDAFIIKLWIICIMLYMYILLFIFDFTSV